MSTILGNAITFGGGGASLNIDYGSTPPTDTTKLWVPLEKKPDGVECSPVPNYGSEKLIYNSEPPVRTSNSSVLGYVGGDTLIYYGGKNKPIYSYNIKTKEYTNLNVNVPLFVSGGGAAYGRNVYTFGGYTSSDGYTSKITKFNADTNQITTLSGKNMSWNAEDVSTAVVGDKIYLFGGISTYVNPNIAIFDPVSESITTLGVTFSYRVAPYAGFAVASVGKNVYFFGGRTFDTQNTQIVQKFDTEEQKLTTLSASVPTIIGINNPAVAFSYGKYIYIVGGNAKKIYKFDTENLSFTTLSYSLASTLSGAGVSTVGNSAYIIGAYEVSMSSLEFTIETNLTQNHLFLQEDYGYDFLWSAIKSKDADLKVKVINAYLGDSNNIAQPTNAYLYDTSTNQWKSLSGESYVADMQTALNILGVT